jgi:hypothetical protein
MMKARLIPKLALFVLAASAIAARAGDTPSSSTPKEVVQPFFAYLAASDKSAAAPDISTDKSAQERWLSRELREELTRANDYIRLQHPKAGGIPISPIDNASFRFAWDPPHKCTIIETISAPYTAIVAAKWIWEPDQQYAGSVQRAYFILVLEDGAWRTLDIQADPYKFHPSKSSLMRTLNSFR